MSKLIKTSLLLPRSAWINTSEGPKQVMDLVGREFTHRGRGEFDVTCFGFEAVGRVPALMVETRAGVEMPISPEQLVLCETSTRQKAGGGIYVDRTWMKASALVAKKELCLERIARPSGVVDPREEALGLLLGQIVGDGGFNPDKYAAYVRFWGDHAQFQAERAAQAVRTYLDVDGRFQGGHYNSVNDVWQVATKSLDRLCAGLIEPGTKSLLPALEMKSRDFVRGFLSGFFNTDGSPQGSTTKGASVRLSQVDLSKLEAVQRMLLRLGIDAAIYKNRYSASQKLMPDGKGGMKNYETRAVHELAIARSSLVTFRRIVNFNQPDKSKRLKYLTENRKRRFYRSRFVAQVLSVTPVDAVEMFACHLDKSQVIAANGLIFGGVLAKEPLWLPHSSGKSLQPVAVF